MGLYEAWHVLRVRTNTDTSVRDSLSAQGMKALSVTQRLETRHKRYGVKLAKELLVFPGYVFIQMPEPRWREVLRLSDVLGVLRVNGQYVPVPPEDMQFLIAMNEVNGFNIERLRRKDRATSMNVEIGDFVYVHRGAFLGKTLRVDAVDNNGAFVSQLEVMGHMVNVPVSPSHVELALKVN